MTVIVKAQLHKTEVYHTETCNNVQSMRNKREVPTDQAQAWGLRPCKTCSNQLGGPLEYDNSAQRLLRNNNSIAELRESINASD